MMNELLEPSTLTPEERAGEVRSEPLAPRITKGLEANFDTAEYDPIIGDTSALTPYGPNVLIKMDVCKKITAGGIELLADKIEQMNEACFTGCIIKLGPSAFRDMAEQHRPTPGMRVYIERYAGIKCTGRDGLMYRVVDEKCIACTIADDLVVAGGI